MPTIDATVARFTGSTAQNSDITSASFTPPANSLLVCTVQSDVTNAATNLVASVAGGGLTWTEVVSRNGTNGGGSAYAGIWTAQVGASPSAMTVTARHTSPALTFRKSAKLYIVEGHDPADPVGATAGGGATANAINVGYTSTIDESRAIGCANDWAAAGAASSSDTEDAAHYSGTISVVSAYKAAATTPAASAVTLNFDAPGAGSVDWTWVAAEIVPPVEDPGTPDVFIRVSGAWVAVDRKCRVSGAWV